MEHRDAHFTSTPLPEALSIENIPENKRPQPEDWKFIQGGMPELVLEKPGLYNVIHRYINQKDPSGTGAVVPTSIFTLKHWGKNTTISRTINGRDVEFPTALVWAYHGKPCEGRSDTNYKRVVVPPLLP